MKSLVKNFKETLDILLVITSSLAGVLYIRNGRYIIGLLWVLMAIMWVISYISHRS